MPPPPPVGPKKTPPAPAMGCAACWAAKYCAAFSALASPQPPPNCPLLPRPAGPPTQKVLRCYPG